jgi:hypothetical protein
MYIVGRVVGFAQFLWQQYVWPKIKRAWRRLVVVVITRLIEMLSIARDELYEKDKSLVLLSTQKTSEEADFGRSFRVVAPMASASVRIATKVKAGLFASMRRAYRNSWDKPLIPRLYREARILWANKLPYRDLSLKAV